MTSVRLLVIGDLHLGRDQSRLVVKTEWEAFDALFFVGDIVDTNARRMTAGQDFFAEIDKLSVDSYVVPGNHDWQSHEQRVEQFQTVYNIDGCTRSIDDKCDLFGQGSVKFDEGPEIRTIKPSSDPEIFRNAVHEIAWNGEGDSDLKDVPDVSITPEEQAEYKRRYRELSTLHEECGSGLRLLISHAPPYGTALDRMDSRRSNMRSGSWGSIALRNFIGKKDLSLTACGHIHESAGAKVVDDTLCVNPGLRNAVEVKLTGTTYQVNDVELDWS